ncbi:MAG: YfhO family protein [Actinobacteria bacterium]|nr:YfhO family protein [Actinomycetota bacterium]
MLGSNLSAEQGLGYASNGSIRNTESSGKGRTRGVHSRSSSDGAPAGIGGDAIAVVLIALFTLVFFYPVISSGTVFGSMADLSLFPLTSGLFKTMHNVVSSDNIQQISPWLLLNWRVIHSGQIPLWNPYSLLGMPQMFNFQSAAMSLPHLVSYLFPASSGYTVSTFISLLVAGTGAYSAARVLGASAAGSLVGAITYEFSGSLANWIGWPQGGVNIWLGWVVFFAILIHRSKRPVAACTAMSVVVAFAMYAGHPESYVLDGFTVLVLGGLITLFAFFTRDADTARLKSTIVKIMVSGLFGGMLAMPMLLPAAQLIPGSIRSTVTVSAYRGIPMYSSVNLLAASYYGLPTASSHWFGPANFYEVSAVVGPLAIVLALVAVFRLGKRPVVAGLATTALVLWLIIFRNGPVQALVSLLHVSGAIVFTRLLMPLDFLLALLAAIGFSRLTSSRITNGDVHAFTLGSGIMATILGVLIILTETATGLTLAERHIRLTALGWSLGSLAIGATLILVWLGISRHDGRFHTGKVWRSAATVRYPLTATGPARSRQGPLWQVTVFSAVLLAQGVLLMPTAMQAASYSHRFYPSDAAVKKVQEMVGDHIMGAAPPPPGASTGWNPTQPIPGTGFEPETNIAYKVAVFGAHDPMLQQEYLSSWQEAERPHKSPLVASPGVFNPWFSNASLARLYGVKYLLALPGANGSLSAPSGTSLVLQDKAFSIYEVPDSHRFSLLPGKSVVKSAENPSNSYGKVTSHRWISNDQLQIHVHALKPATLLARITYVPGWHATVNGKGVAVGKAAGVMLSLRVPKGKSTVDLTYWPNTLTAGIVAAVAAIVGLTSMAVISWHRRRIARWRRARRSSAGNPAVRPTGRHLAIPARSS